MKITKKRFYVIWTVITLMLFCTACGGQKSLEDDPNKDLFYWSVNDDGYAVISAYIGPQYQDVVVPEYFVGTNTESGGYVNNQIAYPVVGIDSWGDTSLSTISFPDTIQWINGMTPNYYGETFELPSGLISIGSEAFKDFHYMGSLILPETLETIGDSAFAGSKITGSVKIPDSVTYLGTYAFSECTGILTLELPSNLEDVPSGLCYGDISLTGTLTIPSGYATIGEQAFAGCHNLTGFNFPDSLREIGANACAGCQGAVGTLNFPTSLYVIGDGAFGCVTINNTNYFCGFTGAVIVPESVKEIGSNAFDGCIYADNLLVKNQNVDSTDLLSSWTTMKEKYNPTPEPEVKSVEQN